MSLLYTRTRLWFDGRRGQAQHDGVERIITRSPKVPRAVAELDYCPELGEYEIRPNAWDRKRDMEPPEVEAVVAWLTRFAAAVKRRIARSRP